MAGHIATLAGPVEDFAGLLEGAGRVIARVPAELLDGPLRSHLADAVAVLVEAARTAGLNGPPVPEPGAPAVVLLRTLGRLAARTAGADVTVPSGDIRGALARVAASVPPATHGSVR